MTTREDLDKNFKYHQPDEEKRALHAEVRGKARSLADTVLVRCPPGREQSIALTKIEEAMFWANAAIARNG